MSSLNGANHHNVEDILASIRSTIADEPLRSSARSQAAPARRDVPVAEEASEFELPAIFKPGYQPAQSKPNILGRISEALKSPASEPEGEPRNRTVVRFEPAGGFSGRMIEPPAAAVPDPSTGEQTERIERDNDSCKRNMTSFFDTRMSRMSQMAAPPPPEPPQPEPVMQPPRLPEPAAGGNEQMEDAAAQLLRPILQQWLSDNMPKIVERALRSEGGEVPPAGLDPRKRLR